MNQVRVLMLPTAYSHGTLGAAFRALSIARALRSMGCSVAFVAAGHTAQVIEEAGFAVYPCPQPTPSGAAVPIRSQVDSIMWTGLADPEFVAAMIRAELEAIESFQPHAAWSDFRHTATISTAAAGVPLATIALWPAHPRFPANQGPDPTVEVFNPILAYYGQSSITSHLELVFMRSALRLAPTLPELEPELAEAEPDVVFFGHTVDLVEPGTLRPWFNDWAGESPGFVYLSVTGLDPSIYPDILIAGFRSTRFRLLCAMGYHYALQDIPPSTEEVRFVRYVPALPVIERSAFVISIAGQNTVMQCLYYGVPSIVFPGASVEREYTASQLSAVGAGITLPLAAFRPKRLLATVEELLAGPYTEAARRLSARLEASGGCGSAARAIVELATSGPQVARTDGGAAPLPPR